MKKLLLLIALSSCMLLADDQIATKDSVTKTYPFMIFGKSTITFGVQPVTADASGAATLTITTQSSRGKASALQVSVGGTATDWSGTLTTNIAPAVAAAGKTLQCNASASPMICIVSGGVNPIPDGALFTVTMTVLRTTTVTLSAPVSSNRFGVQMNSALNPASAIVTLPAPVAALASLTCAAFPGFIDGQIEPGEDQTCTVTLTNAAPTGGAVVQLSQSSTKLANFAALGGTTPITSVTVPAGASSAQFIVRGM